jgi:hypothetical protein
LTKEKACSSLTKGKELLESRWQRKEVLDERRFEDE